MGNIISAYFKGFGQLSDPKTRSVIMKSIGGSVFVFICLYFFLHFILKATAFVAIGWLEFVFDTIAQFGVMALTWFLFPAVVTAVGSLLLEHVVKAVEARHYPDHEIAQSQKFNQSLMPAIKFLGTTIGYNLLILPLFVVPPLWPLIPFIYLCLNGYLLSREYFELVAHRRLTSEDARAMHARWKTPLFLAGIGFAFMLTVPLLNLIAPVIATATMVHMFETWRKKDGIAGKATVHANSKKTHGDDLNSSPKKDANNGTLDGEDDVISLSGPDK